MQKRRERIPTEPRGPTPIADRPATDEDIAQFKAAVLAKLTLAIGKDTTEATGRDWFVATALALRDRIIHRWLASERGSLAQGRKRIYYLSLEFLIGRLLNDVVGNLRLTEVVRRGLGDLGVDMEWLIHERPAAEFKYPYAFDVALDSWTELVCANALYDQAGFVLLSDVHESSTFGPSGTTTSARPRKALASATSPTSAYARAFVGDARRRSCWRRSRRGSRTAGSLGCG